MSLIEFVKTKDGTPTIFDPETGEHHHSLVGAYTEARYKFAEVAKEVIQNRIQKNEKVRLLDLPFGLGYNLIATIDVWDSMELSNGFIECVAVEKDIEVINAIKACPFENELKNKFQKIKDIANGRNKIEETNFSLDLIVDDLLNALPKIDKQFDLIYYDPFSPKTSPSLWSKEFVLRYFYSLLSDEGLLITYTASNKVRKGLQEVGFNIAPSVAVGRKMPGTIASKQTLNAKFSDETCKKIQKTSSY